MSQQKKKSFRKAKTRTENLSTAELDKIIEKGGSVANSNEKVDDDKISRITVRLPELLLREIDNTILQIPKAIRPKRNKWIVEALYRQVQSNEE